MSRTLDTYLKEQVAKKLNIQDIALIKFDSSMDDKTSMLKIDSENQLVKKYIDEVEH